MLGRLGSGKGKQGRFLVIGSSQSRRRSVCGKAWICSAAQRRSRRVGWVLGQLLQILHFFPYASVC